MYTKKVEREKEFLQGNILNKMNKTNIKVEFRMLGKKFNVEEVTKILDVLPTSCWKKGEKVRNTERRYTEWTYSTQCVETLDLNVPLRELKKMFILKADALCTLKEKYDLDYILEVVVIIENDEVPAMYFESDILQFLSKIGAEIDIDMYIN